MRLIEFLARVYDALEGECSRRYVTRRALAIVGKRWPTVHHFTDAQLEALIAELRKDVLRCTGAIGTTKLY